MDEGSGWLWAAGTLVVGIGAACGFALAWAVGPPAAKVEPVSNPPVQVIGDRSVPVRPSARPSQQPSQRLSPRLSPAVEAPAPVEEVAAVAADPVSPVEVVEELEPAVLEPAAVDCAAEDVKCVALTFDDGPSRSTGELLDMLENAGVPATFFVTGQSVEARPETLQRMQELGMEVGVHGWDHVDMRRLGPEQQRSQLDRSAEAVLDAGLSAPVWYRPAYGEHDATTRSLGWPLVLWDVDTLDWKHRDPQRVVAEAMAGIRPGSIVLMHDLHASTVAAVPELLERLQATGYTPVTVSTLLGAPEPGRVYSRG